MSLINEALKKAQRDRHLEGLPSVPGGGARASRGQRMSTSTLVLLGSGGLVLFVLAVVGTVLFINRPAAPVAIAAPAVVKTPPKPAPEPAPSAPLVALPLAITKPAPEPAASVSMPAPVAAAVATPLPMTALAATAPAAREPATPAASNTITFNINPSLPASGSEKFDPRIQTMVEAWRITAVRSSGAESKLFMNGNVYRLNDVVDRTSGLRLTNVTESTLTFTDAGGVTYVKRYN